MDEILFKYTQILEPEMQRYMDCMTDINVRWLYIKKRIESKNFDRTKRNTEAICLQFRMIIELVMLANFSSHEKYFSYLLFELAKVYNIHEMIRDIEKLNVDYYPKPIKLETKKVEGKSEADGLIHFIKSPITKETLLKMHSECSEFLHPQNPFRIDKDYVKTCNSFPEWLKKIKALLRTHSVQLVDKSVKIFCDLDFESTNQETNIKVGFLHRNH